MKGCPHCGKPAHPIMDADGHIIWRNLFHIDIPSILMVVAIIFLLLGFQQINKQCYEIVKDPCAGYTKYCGNNLYSPMGENVSYVLGFDVNGSVKPIDDIQ